MGLREDLASRDTYCSGSFLWGQSTGAVSSGGLGDRQERHMRTGVGRDHGREGWGDGGEGGRRPQVPLKEGLLDFAP